MFIATGAYSGYLPKAPGTWGSLIGVLLWSLGLYRLAPPAYVGMLGGLLVVGMAAAGSAEKIVDRGDPGLVVIDEILGQLITLALVPWHPLAALAGFVLFRFFDILKPFPVSWFDQHIHGGLGIMLDDVMAGIYAFLVLQGLIWLVGS
ncbi:MAG: phosphatidylglycerophosphatase A [Candidatus Electrothrix sp. MAN1_4]|nr:phosphatidylglycerophosphatase A [Candidatus Electrothrix sp. MAN1_4]